MKIFGTIIILLLETFVIKGIFNLYKQNILDDPEYNGFVPIVGVVGTTIIVIVASALAILSISYC